MFSSLVIRLWSFCFNDTATTEIYTLSLHDALPICFGDERGNAVLGGGQALDACATADADRKSTRLNSSHVAISYAVFCLKQKKSSILLESFLYTQISSLKAGCTGWVRMSWTCR